MSGIYLYTIGSGGALTIGNGGAVISSDIPAAMQVSGSWLIDAFIPTTGTVQMNAIPINASTGAYAGSGAPPYQAFNVTNASVQQMALSPDGDQFVCRARQRAARSWFPSPPATRIRWVRQATVIPVVNSNGSALSVAVDPTNRLFYIGETLANSAANSGGLRVFNYSSLSGALTQLSGSPIASGGLAPNAILPIASGEYVYVANGQGNTGRGTSHGFPFPLREPPIRSLRATTSPPALCPWALPRTAR